MRLQFDMSVQIGGIINQNKWDKIVEYSLPETLYNYFTKFFPNISDLFIFNGISEKNIDKKFVESKLNKVKNEFPKLVDVDKFIYTCFV
jgi:hypothetical protein